MVRAGSYVEKQETFWRAPSCKCARRMDWLPLKVWDDKKKIPHLFQQVFLLAARHSVQTPRTTFPSRYYPTMVFLHIKKVPAKCICLQYSGTHIAANLCCFLLFFRCCDALHAVQCAKAIFCRRFVELAHSARSKVNGSVEWIDNLVTKDMSTVHNLNNLVGGWAHVNFHIKNMPEPPWEWSIP